MPGCHKDCLRQCTGWAGAQAALSQERQRRTAGTRTATSRHSGTCSGTGWRPPSRRGSSTAVVAAGQVEEQTEDAGLDAEAREEMQPVQQQQQQQQLWALAAWGDVLQAGMDVEAALGLQVGTMKALQQQQQQQQQQQDREEMHQKKQQQQRRRNQPQNQDRPDEKTGRSF